MKILVHLRLSVVLIMSLVLVGAMRGEDYGMKKLEEDLKCYILGLDQSLSGFKGESLLFVVNKYYKERSIDELLELDLEIFKRELSLSFSGVLPTDDGYAWEITRSVGRYRIAVFILFKVDEDRRILVAMVSNSIS